MATTEGRFLRYALLAAFTVAPAAAAGADDIDDARKKAKEGMDVLVPDEYERIFGERMAKLGQLSFIDQEYCLAKALGKDTGWSAPDKPFVFKPSMASGPVFWATWSSGKKAEAQPSVTFVVTRYVGADGKTTFGEMEAANSDAFALVQAASRAWSAGLEKVTPPAEGEPAPTDPAAKEAEADRLACVEAVKKANGVATVFAAAQGRLTATKKRQRREWYGWSGKDASWVVCARYDESVLSKTNAALTKGKLFIGSVHVYKGVSAK